MRHDVRMGAASLILVGMLAACGDLPRPFEDTASPLARPATDVDVAVAPVAGAPTVVGDHLPRSVADALADHQIHASARAGDTGRFRLAGTAETGGGPGSPYIATITWTLFDAEGEPVGLHTQGVVASRAYWEAGDWPMIQRLAGEAAEPIACLVADAGGIAEAVAANAFRVMVVRGAPGDGNAALTGAMRRALLAAGHPVAAESAPAAYRLIGTVGVEPPQNGRQAVRIVWQVIAADGTSLGRAVQENAVAAGSLDGAWGATAEGIARAALPGITAVVEGAAPVP